MNAYSSSITCSISRSRGSCTFFGLSSWCFAAVLYADREYFDLQLICIHLEAIVALCQGLINIAIEMS